MFIKNWHGTCSCTIVSRTHSATLTSLTMESTASTSYVYQELTWHMFISYHLKKNRLKWLQGDQDTLRYPATLISSTMLGTVVSTRHIHQNFTWHMLIIYHFTKTNRCKRSQCPTGWSKCSCTTSSNSTMASTANQ